MDRANFAIAIHAAVCLVVGGIVWWLGGVNWAAAAFWCSAVLYLTGSVADIEDSEPGGFDNPQGRNRPLGSAYFIGAFTTSLCLAGIGFTIQLWLGNSAS